MLATALGLCPTLGLLRKLQIEGSYYDSSSGLNELAKCPSLGNVRRFQIGPESNCHMDGEGVDAVLRKMPRLEELYLYARGVPVADVFALPMPNLRTLHVYHLDFYPLHILANNSTLGNLITLECWPHALEPDDDRAYIDASDFRALVNSPNLKSLTHLALYLSDIGDEGIAALVKSGMLKQLRVLDLWSGRITDEGAQTLAACQDVRRLEKLRLSQNALTEAGIDALKATGINLEAINQYDPGSIAGQEYLWEGDCE